MSAVATPPPRAAGSVPELLAAHERRPDRLIELLHELQDAVGYLRREDLLAVAHGLGLPVGEVLGVATFYPHFRLVAPPRHRCAVCVGAACSLHGAAATCSALAARWTKVPPERWRWEVVSCVGACGVAPVVLYDGVATARQSAPSALARVEAWN